VLDAVGRPVPALREIAALCGQHGACVGDRARRGARAGADPGVRA
jgi:hypothetical protein